MTPDRFVADGDLVVALGRDGEIVGFVEHLDTAAMNAALAGRTIDLREDASTTVS